jgi:hypothetical protein
VLAAALGFERSTITKAESGARPPADDVFKKWCCLAKTGATPGWAAAFPSRVVTVCPTQVHGRIAVADLQ